MSIKPLPHGPIVVNFIRTTTGPLFGISLDLFLCFSHGLCDLCVCSPFSEDTLVLVMLTKATITSYNNVVFRAQFICTMYINPLLSSPATLVHHLLGPGTFKCQPEIQSSTMLSSDIHSNPTQCAQCLSSSLIVFLFAPSFIFLM